MSKGIFITGTGVNIGKTFVAAEMIKTLRKNNINACYFKGILTGGIERGENLKPNDAKYVCEISGLNELYENIVPYVLETPVSPHLASELEDVNIDLNFIKEKFIKLKNKYDCIVMEGCAGAACPIKIENDKIILLEDIIKMLGLSVIVVADSNIGTINHTYLTIKYLNSINVRVKGIILDNYKSGNYIHEDNKIMLEEITGVEVLATIPYMPNGTENYNLDFDKIYNLLDEIRV